LRPDITLRRQGDVKEKAEKMIGTADIPVGAGGADRNVGGT
jgi:hypothetical protein